MRSPEFRASSPENNPLDISSLSDDELKTRREQILAELARRRATEETAKSTSEAIPRIPIAEAAPSATPSEVAPRVPTHEREERVTKDTVKKSILSHPIAKKALLGVAAIGIVAAAIFATGSRNKTEKTPTLEPTPAVSQTAETPSTDEEETTTIRYDYNDWRKFDEKSSHNAYGTSRIDCYENPELTSFEFMKTANNLPEALASYKGAFFEDEQEALGIRDMTENQIDNTISDPNNTDATAFQTRLLDKLQSIIDDTENTKWVYNLENGTEISHYIIWEDLNGDGEQTPEEMHLGWSKSPRKNAPQANLYRKDKNGNWVKMLDLNLYCRLQPNTETPSPDLPFIPNEEPQTTPDEPVEGGSSKATIPNTSPEDPSDSETPSETVDDGDDDSSDSSGGEDDGGSRDEDDDDDDIPAQTPTPTSKSYENLSRIDDDVEENEKDQLTTDDLNTGHTTRKEQEEKPVTTQPESSTYHETIEEVLFPSEVTPVQSTASREAESATTRHEDGTSTATRGATTSTSSENIISSENDISEDITRGANFESSDSYAPVQPDASALEANERAERTNTPEAPASAMPESFTLSDGTEVVIPSGADANLGTGGGYSIDDLLNANFGQ